MNPIPWVRQLWLCDKAPCLGGSLHFFPCTLVEFSFETSVHNDLPRVLGKADDATSFQMRLSWEPFTI